MNEITLALYSKCFDHFIFELSLTGDRTHDVPCATFRLATKARGLAYCATSTAPKDLLQYHNELDITFITWE